MEKETELKLTQETLSKMHQIRILLMSNRKDKKERIEKISLTIV